MLESDNHQPEKTPLFKDSAKDYFDYAISKNKSQIDELKRLVSTTETTTSNQVRGAQSFIIESARQIVRLETLNSKLKILRDFILINQKAQNSDEIFK